MAYPPARFKRYTHFNFGKPLTKEQKESLYIHPRTFLLIMGVIIALVCFYFTIQHFLNKREEEKNRRLRRIRLMEGDLINWAEFRPENSENPETSAERNQQMWLEQENLWQEHVAESRKRLNDLRRKQQRLSEQQQKVQQEQQQLQQQLQQEMQEHLRRLQQRAEEQQMQPPIEESTL